MQWSIDAGDAYSVASVRRSIIEELHHLTGQNADLFTVESVLGELLSSEMERGHVAIAVIVERGGGGALVHVHTQGPYAGESTRGELRHAILSGARLPMAIETTAQGTHYCLRVAGDRETFMQPISSVQRADSGTA